MSGGENTATGDDPVGGMTRREVLATTGTGALVGLAGCGDQSDECDVAISKDAQGDFHYGREVTYVFDVCNEGGQECTEQLEIRDVDGIADAVSDIVSTSGNWNTAGLGSTIKIFNDNDDGLAPDECSTCELVVELKTACEFSGDPPHEVENCAEVYHPSGGDTPSDEDCVTREVTHGSCGLSFEKDTDGEFHYGQQATYTYEVCNEQEAVCTGPLTVEDDLPDGVSLVDVSGDWTATASGGVVTASNDSHCGLDPGECLTMEMTVAVAPAGEFPGEPPIENCATLAQSGTAVAEDCVTHDVTPGGGPGCDLSIEKETAGEFVYGEEGTYVFEVCNDGTETCTGHLAIEDELPTGISFGDVSGGEWIANPSGGAITVANDNDAGLAPGECTSFEMTVDVVPPGEAPDEVENCATLTHDGDVVAEDCVDHPLSYGDCELSFEKRVAEEFHVGQENTYVFEICNEDDEPCGGPLTIEDDLPDGISFVDVGGPWDATVSGGVVEATLDTSPLAPGECITVEMAVDADGPDEFPGEEVQNCATLLHAGESVAEDCTEHPVTIDPCELSIRKNTGSFGGFHYGGLGTYVFEICNVGDTECTGPVTVEDDLPDGISFGSTSADWSSDLSAGVVTATNDSHDGLAPGECLSMELTVAVDDADEFPGDGAVENCADLYYSGSLLDDDCVTHRVTPADSCPPVEYVLNTGYDQDGASTLGGGDDDGDWRLTQDTTGSGPVPRPATVVGSGTVSGTWPAPFPDNRWVAHREDAAIETGSTGETVTYEYCFCLHETVTDPELSVRLLADDEVSDIQLNGSSLSYTGDGSVSLGSPPIQEVYTDPGLFQAGENCLRITVEDTNEAVSGLTLTGRVRAGNADCDCDAGGGSDCDLSLTKSTTGTFHYGEQHRAGYVYEVCNDGDAECSGELGVTDPLPDGITGPVQPGSGLTGGVTSGVFDGTVQYSGLAPGECLTRELFVTVEDADAFPGDPPHEVENCADLDHDGTVVDDDCTTHDVTRG